MTARGLALVRAAQGDLGGALGWVEESLSRSPWYLWVQGYALQTGVVMATAAGDARGENWRRQLEPLVGRAQLALPSLTIVGPRTDHA
jgi:hypothetical protein